jgi:hypothetical protein
MAGKNSKGLVTPSNIVNERLIGSTYSLIDLSLLSIDSMVTVVTLTSIQYI